MDLPKRKPQRLHEYDYSQNGAYFVTICTHEKKHVLSSIVGGGFHAAPQIVLTAIGEEIQKGIEYKNTRHENNIQKFVIMPNHVHMIVLLRSGGHGNPPLQDLVRDIKSFSTKRYNEMSKTENAILWQRSFHDHIIRDENGYLLTWKYIEENPLKWQEDEYFSSGVF